MKSEVSSSETGTRSVKRAADLLRALADAQGGASLTDLAKATELSKATAYRILQTLMAEGFVSLDEEPGAYRIGAELVRITAAARKASEDGAWNRLASLGLEVMEALRETTRETVVLVVRKGGHRENIAVALGRHELISAPRVGARHRLPLGGPGKLFLAHLPWSEAESLIVGLDDQAGRALDPAALKIELERIRETGFATSFGEAVDGQASVAAPIWKSGALVAVLNLIVPTVRFDENNKKRFSALVLKAAEDLSSTVEKRWKPHE